MDREPILDDVALFRAIPALTMGKGGAPRVPWVRLGHWPTPVERIDLDAGLDGVVRGGLPLWIKRDDLSAPRYGGNKVRTLEALFGQARAAGARRIWATGAYGSNHALATALHAPHAGLEPGALLFPQPTSACARENLVATLSARPHFAALWSWASLPWAIARARRGDVPSFVMVPGGATPVGALGYVSAAFELAAQVHAGVLPPPARIVVAVGSTCTAAGLLYGTALAARRVGGGAGAAPPPSPPPQIVAVRVTPWPVTAPFRIVGLAAATGRLLAALTGDASLVLSRAELAARLTVTGAHLGRGYGRVTADGRDAIARFAAAGGPPLDTSYSGKAAAALFASTLPGPPGPTVFWATKSSPPLPPVDAAAVAAAPARVRRWLARRDPSG